MQYIFTEFITQKCGLKMLSMVIFLSLFFNEGITGAVAQEKKIKYQEDELREITVSDDALARDEKGKDDIYDLNLSTTFAGFEEVQRFKGTTSSDIFNGMVGVASGDARNSGAIDPNVRGVQGEGRVPVIIDGTEQAVTVWRGYNGANNRNYVDSMLISNLQVEKGPSLTRGVSSSVGGAVIINTLEADDIIPEGQNFGFNIMMEGSTNSVKPRIPHLKSGEDIYDDVPGNEILKMMPNDYQTYRLNHPELNLPVNQGNYAPNFGLVDPQTLKFSSKEGRNRLGDDYAFRIAAAKRWQDFELTGAIVERRRGNYFAGTKGWENYYSNSFDIDPTEYNVTTKLANLYKPGAEVFNTSNNTLSFLGKIKWTPNSEHTFKLGLRHSDSNYGEIFPTQLENYLNFQGFYQKNKLPQWTLSSAKTSALSFDWDYKPEDNKWINLETNLWATYSDLNTNTSGQAPRTAYNFPTGFYDPRGILMQTVPICRMVPPAMIDANPRLTMMCRGAWAGAKWMKANNMPLPPQQQAALDKMLSYEDQVQLANKTYVGASITNSKETRIGFNISNKMELDPKLDLTLGAAYQYARLRSDDNWWENNRFNEFKQSVADFFGTGGAMTPILNQMGPYSFIRPAHPREGTRHYVEATAKFDWRPTDRLDLSAGLKFNYYNSFDDHTARMIKEGVSGYENVDMPQKWHDVGWAPTLSGSFYITDSTRLYARLAQAVRHPSLFESTRGFSNAINSGTQIEQLKSEKATNIEVGLTQDLSSFLPQAEYADIKLTYYHNTIKNAFERDVNFEFTNMDKQINSGIELQGRYDSGRFFADISGSYSLDNKVCDAKWAEKARSLGWATTDLHGNCADGGFPNGYLQNTVPPKYTWQLGVGARFMDNKLTVGTRIRHHSKPRHNTEFRSNFNNVMFWDDATIFDAYMKYQDKDWSAELTGTNLTDLYYLEQYSRTMMPAPGRTVKLTFNKTF